MRILAWTGVVFYLLIVVLAVPPLTDGTGGLGWAVGGLAVPPVVAVASLRVDWVGRSIAVGLALFVAAFLVFNGYAVGA